MRVLTAEYMAQKYQIPRQRQDEFSFRSHRLAAEATTSGAFNAAGWTGAGSAGPPCQHS